MRLAELEPAWVRWHDGNGMLEVASIDDAQGIRFLCPVCYAANDGPIGTHMVCCWSRSRGVPNDALPGPGRWQLLGSNFEDLTLGAEKDSTASVKLPGADGDHAHFHIASGLIVPA